jgi:lipoprotein-anchoring transpeptidase ErfK/SrfK
MRTRLAVLVTAALAVLAVSAAAAAPPLAEGVTFKPVAKSGVAGTGTVTQNGVGTAVVVRLTGLKPNSTARVLLRSGRYPQLSASFAQAVNVKADARGRGRASSAIRFRNEPVAFHIVADGRHVLTVVAGGKIVALAEIPGLD